MWQFQPRNMAEGQLLSVEGTESSPISTAKNGLIGELLRAGQERRMVSAAI
jgi:hypothetical protein